MKFCRQGKALPLQVPSRNKIIQGGRRRSSYPSVAQVARMGQLCYNCGYPDHLRSECPLAPIACFICGELGHLAPFCQQGSVSSQQDLPLSGVERVEVEAIVRTSVILEEHRSEIE